MPDDASLRDPDADRWKPVAGPFEWEERTEASKAAWTDGREQHNGLAVRDAFNDEAYIVSDLYAPDLNRML